MKANTFYTLVLLLVGFSMKSFAGDVYAEYKMSGINNKNTISKMYFKNGDRRSEVNMDVAGKEMTTVSLNLKSKPDVTISYNSYSKTYREIKKGTGNTKEKDFTIKVIGNEKIGAYNCKRIRMTSDDKSWDMWITKDLPKIDFPVDNNNEASNHKIMDLLKSNDAEGMLVKLEFYKPNTTEVTITMELVKYETKNLDESLFKIPADYTKSTVDYDPDKMKSMTNEEKQEMIKKMMEENMPKK